LPDPPRATMLCTIFVVSEKAAVAIRAAYEAGGALSAAVELPGIPDNAEACCFARAIAGWQPLPL
jgi:hypothetical protein